MSEPYGGPPETGSPYGGQPPQYGQQPEPQHQYGQLPQPQHQYGQLHPQQQYAANPYGPYPGYAPYPVAGQPTNGIGIAGFVCSLVGLVFFWIPFFGVLLAVVGTVLSGVGLAQGNKNGASTGLAIAGLVIGIVALVPGILFLVFVASI